MDKRLGMWKKLLMRRTESDDDAAESEIHQSTFAESEIHLSCFAESKIRQYFAGWLKVYGNLFVKVIYFHNNVI